MPIGFQDDPTFRWIEGAPDALDRVAGGATPRSSARPRTGVRSRRGRRRARRTRSTPAYSFNDLDDMIRNAQAARHPGDADDLGHARNGRTAARRPNVPPKKVADLTNFARALADRYSGRHAGYPYVGHFSIWNEPNLKIFLSPQFNKKGKIVSPARLRQALQGGLRRDQEGRTRPRSSRSARRRTRAVTIPAKGGGAELGRAGHLRAAARPDEGPEVRRLRDAPVRDAAEPAADAEGALAERDADPAAALRDLDRPVVPRGRTSRSGSPSTATRRSRASPLGVTNSQQAKYMSSVMRKLQGRPARAACSSGSSSGTRSRASGRAASSTSPAPRSRRTGRSRISRRRSAARRSTSRPGLRRHSASRSRGLRP